MHRTVQEINAGLEEGEAAVLTAREMEDLLTCGQEDEVRRVDVVTGTMSS